MWHCSRCGEAIPDNFDVCWHCGAHDGGTASKEFQAEPDDRSVPDPKSELPEADPTTVEEMTPSGRPKRALTQESLAALLLRLLGLYLTVVGIVGGVAEAGYVVLLSNRLGLDNALRQYHFAYLIRPGAELIVGFYFLVGGQWVYDKILTPIRRSFPEDASQGAEDDDPDDRQGQDNTRSVNSDPPQLPPSANQPDG
jgi:hypothetical protein